MMGKLLDEVDAWGKIKKLANSMIYIAKTTPEFLCDKFKIDINYKDPNSDENLVLTLDRNNYESILRGFSEEGLIQLAEEIQKCYNPKDPCIWIKLSETGEWKDYFTPSEQKTKK